MVLHFKRLEPMVNIPGRHKVPQFLGFIVSYFKVLAATQTSHHCTGLFGMRYHQRVQAVTVGVRKGHTPIPGDVCRVAKGALKVELRDFIFHPFP